MGSGTVCVVYVALFPLLPPPAAALVLNVCRRTNSGRLIFFLCVNMKNIFLLKLADIFYDFLSPCSSGPLQPSVTFPPPPSEGRNSFLPSRFFFPMAIGSIPTGATSVYFVPLSLNDLTFLPSKKVKNSRSHGQLRFSRIPTTPST